MDPVIVDFRISALAPPLSQQLTDQKLKFNVDGIKVLEQYCDMLLRLNLGDILTDKETNKARDRVAKKVFSHVKKMNKLKSTSPMVITSIKT